MKIQYHNQKIPYFLVDNFYTEEEENSIKQEMDFLLPILEDPTKTFSAADGGVFLKQNSGIFVDTVYSKRSHSRILTINRKTFTFLEDQKKSLTTDDWFFKHQETSSDTTLISYYEQSDYYKPHKDEAIFTSLCWFNKEPKSYSGGDLTFTDFDITIECKNNRMLVFPSFIKHEVSEVKPNKDKIEKGYGRWCLTQFASA